MVRVALFSIVVAGVSKMSPAEQVRPLAYALVIHGGAGAAAEDMLPAHRQRREQVLGDALRQGKQLLVEGGTSLDVVEQVIRILEDDPHFNAGRGSVLNAAGEVEMDASIMDGRTRACGAVSAVRAVRNPISLARRVMSETRHVLLTAGGADAFARDQHQPRATLDYLRTDDQLRRWEMLRAKSGKDARAAGDLDHYATVGCVALDTHGNLAAGTSTGGLSLKQFGRVGDSPIIGAGTYADNETCGVSCTGIGEQYIRHVVAYDIAARMKYRGESLDEAVRENLQQRLRPGDGGIIAVDRLGRIAAQFTTGGMPRAWADANGTFEIKIGK